MLTLGAFQKQVKEWQEHNFPDHEPWEPLVGLSEEVGELSHAHLKRYQGIRKDEDHEANGQDAIGDILVYLADYCTQMGWSLQECLDATWQTVRERDWKKDPIGGHND